MSEKCKINSHVLHPQIKSKHANKESEKLTNHDTTPASAAAPLSNNSGASKISESFKGATGAKVGSETAQKSGSVMDRAINFFSPKK